MRILLFFVPVYLLAQSGLRAPDLGLMLDRNGFLRPVSGAAGSFVVGEARAGKVLSFACSQSTCVAKTQDSIVAGGAIIPAPPGPAAIAASDSGTTLYFRQSGQFAWLQNGALQTLDWIVDGDVLSMVSAGGIKFAVKRDTGIWITVLDGSILDSLPPATAVLLLPDAAVYATANELALRRADGSEMRFECPGVTELFAMSDGWVEARSSSGLFALRTDEGHERLYVLPQPAGQIEQRREARP